MMELYQTEWCPSSHLVRERLTELGIDFVAKQVPAEPAGRFREREETSVDSIPVLVTDGAQVLVGVERILAHLDANYGEPLDARRHRAKAQEMLEG